MRYEVRSLVAGEEHVQQVEATDAAEAASNVKATAPENDTFELLSITVIDPLPQTELNPQCAESAIGG